MKLDDYADWISENLSNQKNIEQWRRQKEIQEPPPARPFRLVDPPETNRVAEPHAPWPEEDT
jgi:hypothetical protein